MTFLHLSDLHLGKRLYHFDLLEDQRHILAQILEIAGGTACDAVLIAGDIYDRGLPPAGAVKLADEFFSQLAALRKPVFVISGNHDAAERIAFLAQPLRASGLYFAQAFDGAAQCEVLTDEYGEVGVYLLPYIKPAQVRAQDPDSGVQSYEDALRVVLAKTPVDPARRNILVAHQFVTGARLSGSEELVVGTVESVPAALFKAFDYVALGHLHSAQQVTRETLRYCGSPLTYSFPDRASAGKAPQHNSVTLVTLGEKGDVCAALEPLRPLRAVRVLAGSMDELMAMPYTEDYVSVTVIENEIPNDARGTLQMVFPYLAALTVRTPANETVYDDLSMGDAPSPQDLPSLFEEFYAMQNPRGQMDGARREAAARAMRRAKEKLHETD